MPRTFLEIHAEITRLLAEFGEQWESVSHKVAIQTILDAADIAWKRAPVTTETGNAILIESEVLVEVNQADRKCAACEGCENGADGGDCQIPSLSPNLYICFNGCDRLVCFKAM